MSDWPVGLSTGCFYRTSIFDVLPLVCEGGFTMLEISSYPAHLDHHDLDAVARARARLRDLGLETYSYHAPYGEAIDISAPDSERREHSRREIKRAAETAARLEARHLVLHPGPELAARLSLAEHRQRLVHAADVIDDVARRCHALGTRLVIENMLPHLIFGGGADMLWLTGALDELDVGICLDTGHAHLAGELNRLVHRFAGQLLMVHANDNGGSHDDHWPPGEGDIGWHDLLTRLHDERFAGAFILELGGDTSKTPQEILAAARQARHRLRRLGARIALGERAPGVSPP